MMNPKLKAVMQGIRTSNFTNEELNVIVTEIVSARAALADKVKRQLSYGTKVSWETRKRGYPPVMVGTVTGFKTKNVLVSTQYGNWRVAPSMLRVEE